MGTPRIPTPTVDASTRPTPEAAMVSQERQLKAEVDRLTKEWKRVRSQKQRLRGGVEARVLLSLCSYFGEQYAGQTRDMIATPPITKEEDANKLFLVFNLIRRTTRRRIGRIWGVSHEYSVTPSVDDPRAFDKAEVASKALKGLDRILRQKDLFWTKLFWVAVGGVCVEHATWMPDAQITSMPMFDEMTGEVLFRDRQTQQVMPQQQVMLAVQAGATPERFIVAQEPKLAGEVASEMLGPLNFFIDHAVTRIHGSKTSRGLGPDQWAWTAHVKTADWIGDVFGTDAQALIENMGSKSDLSIVQTTLADRGPSYAGVNLKDLIPAIQGSKAPDDPNMAVVLTGYQPASPRNPYGRRVILVPGLTLLDDQEIPTACVPLVDTHWEPAATTFFGGDFITDLIPPQKFLNKRLSQLGESANASIYEVLLLGPELSKTDIPADMPGVVQDALTPDGVPLVQPLQRGGLQSWFIESIRMVVEFFEHIGGSDLHAVKNKFKDMRGSEALPELQEILDSEDGPFYSHLGEQEALVRELRLSIMRDNYPPSRVLNFTGPNGKDEVLHFYTDEVLRAGYDFTVSVDPGTLMPELTMMREAKVARRLQGPMQVLYINRRTGMLDPTMIADDLKMSDRQRESRASQARKLARQLLALVNDGRLIAEQVGQDMMTGQPQWQLFLDDQPFQPVPSWDHDAMMDEYEAVMATMEFVQGSPPYRQAVASLYDTARGVLTQIQQASQNALMAQSMHSAVAQATQQVAAMTAAATVDQSREQMMAQGAAAAGSPIEQQLRDLMVSGRDGGNPRALPPGQSLRGGSPKVGAAR